MLLLSRRVDETVVAFLDGREILRIHPTEIMGNKVRLAIEAPEEVHILRGELIGREPQPAGAS